MTGQLPVTHSSYVRQVRAGTYLQNVHAESIFVGSNAINGTSPGAVLLGAGRDTPSSGDCCCVALTASLAADVRAALVELRRPDRRRP